MGFNPGTPGSRPGPKAGTKPLSHPGIPRGLIIFFQRFYLFIHERHREREREAETQAEGEAGSMQGARCGIQSRAPRIMPWAEGGTKPLSHRGCPRGALLVSQCFLPSSFVPFHLCCPLLSYTPPLAGNDSSKVTVWLPKSGILPGEDAAVTQFSE